MHPEFWELIDAHADGALAPAEAARLREHLDICTDCTARLAGARREAAQLRLAFAAPEPPPGLADAVLARVEGRRRRGGALRPALIAGVLGNLVTAAVLLLLSLDAGVSVALMLLVAAVGAVAWGGIKGLAFAGLLRYLPEGTLARGLLFGLGVWALTNALLALAGGFGAQAEYSAPFMLLGSLLHHAAYGLLLSWLYARLTATTRRGVSS